MPGADPMFEQADEAARLLRAMAHAPRLRLLCLLLEGPRRSGEMARALGQREAAASQQLALLRAERLVMAHRAGRHVIYALANPLVAALVAVLQRHFCPLEPQASRPLSPAG